jgi:predicted metalloendopeptidase
LKTLLNQLDCLHTAADVAAEMGRRAAHNSASIIPVGQSPDEIHSKHLYLFLYVAPKGLPNKDYYFKKGRRERDIYKAYKSMLAVAGTEFSFVQLEEFADAERAYMRILDHADEEETVSLTGAEIMELTPHIPWAEFWEPLQRSIAEFRKTTHVVYSRTWLRHVSHMFRTYTVDQWKLWLRATAIIEFGELMPAAISDHFHNLYRTLLTGRPQAPTRAALMFSYVRQFMKIPLSRLYVREYHKPGFRATIATFMESIRAATIERIGEIEWMKPATKVAAVKKVRNIHFGVLYMTDSYNYMSPQLGADPIENILKLGLTYMQTVYSDVAKKYTTNVWDDVPVYNVNAYYMSAGNRLFIPAAIASWPFYCEAAGNAWNYGGLGAVIGHEITHAFDDNGKDFDEHGNRTEWWTAGDKQAYSRRANNIISAFRKSKLYGQAVDGEQTLSENIADLGGVAIALCALKKQLEGSSSSSSSSDSDHLVAYREFFKSYATSWREKERKAHGMRSLITDVHSPAMFRVNNIVPHFQEWYDAFNISESDPLYIAPEKRLRIF